MTTIAALVAIALCILLVSLCVRGLYRLFRTPGDDFDRLSDEWKPPPRRDE